MVAAPRPYPQPLHRASLCLAARGSRRERVVGIGKVATGDARCFEQSAPRRVGARVVLELARSEVLPAQHQQDGTPEFAQPVCHAILELPAIGAHSGVAGGRDMSRDRRSAVRRDYVESPHLLPELLVQQPLSVVVHELGFRVARVGAYPRIHEHQPGDPRVFTRARVKQDDRGCVAQAPQDDAADRDTRKPARRSRIQGPGSTIRRTASIRSHPPCPAHRNAMRAHPRSPARAPGVRTADGYLRDRGPPTTMTTPVSE